MKELREIVEKFAESGWDLIAIPSKTWLEGKNNKEELINSVKEADRQCGSCGCEFDALYKRFLEII